MFKIHINSLEYLGIITSLEKKINLNNINKLSKKNIQKIGIKIPKDIFYIFKRNLFFLYFDKNKNHTNTFINKANRLLKKLDIQLKEYEYKYVNDIVKEEFNLKRSKKSIDLSFDLPKKMKTKAYFKLKDVYLYERNDFNFFNLKLKGELYFFTNELLFFSQEKNQILQIINLKDILAIKEEKFGLSLTFENKESHPLFIRSKNQNTLLIFFKRMYHYKI